MSTLFVIFLIIAYGFAFCGAQANTIAQGMEGGFGIPNWGTAIAWVIITAIMVYAGIKPIARTGEVIVPIMAVGHFVVAAYSLIMNDAQVPAMLALIMKSAFGSGPVTGFGERGYTAIAWLGPFLLAMVFIGSVATLSFVWHFADFAMGLMATTNLVAILLLFPIALRVLRDYEKQRRAGTGDPVFSKRVLKKPQQVESSIWD